MYRNVLTIAIVAITVLTGGCATDTRRQGDTAAAAPGSTSATTTLQGEVRVGEVIPIVIRALQDTQSSLSGLPPLKSVTLTLATTVEKVQGGEFELFVKIGGERATSSTHEIVVELSPPTSNAHEISAKDLYAELKDAILAAARAAADANAAAKDILKTSSFSTEIGFDVKRTVSGGIELDVAPVTIGASGARTTKHANKITISFEDK